MNSAISLIKYKKFNNKVELTELKQINYLVGKNNSGKSSFLEAVLLAGLSYNPEREAYEHTYVDQQFAKADDYFFNKIPSEIEIQFDELKVTFDKRDAGRLYKNIIKSNDIGKLPRTLYIPCQPDYVKEPATMSGANFTSHVASQGILPLGQVVAWIFNNEMLKKNNDEICKMGESNEFVILKEIVKEFFDGIILTRPYFDPSNNEKILKYKESEMDLEKPLYLLGSGTRSMINLIAAIVYAKNFDLILIDEPEVHLHPSLERNIPIALNRTIEKSEKQIIIATQSPFAIANANRENEKIYLFKVNANGNISVDSDFENKNIQLSVAMEIGSDDPSAIGAPQNFVLVEEASLVRILEFVDRKFYRRNICFISCSGVNGVPSKNNAISNLINHNQIIKCTPIYNNKHLIVVDRLNAEHARNEQLIKIKKALGERFIELQNDRIEDYYNPEFIIEFYKKEARKSDTQGGAEEFFSWIGDMSYKEKGEKKCALADYICTKLASREAFETIFPDLSRIFID